MTTPLPRHIPDLDSIRRCWAARAVHGAMASCLAFRTWTTLLCRLRAKPCHAFSRDRYRYPHARSMKQSMCTRLSHFPTSTMDLILPSISSELECPPEVKSKMFTDKDSMSWPNINWKNLTFLVSIPLLGILATFRTPLQTKTAIWALIYLGATGLGITAGMTTETLQLVQYSEPSQQATIVYGPTAHTAPLCPSRYTSPSPAPPTCKAQFNSGPETTAPTIATPTPKQTPTPCKRGSYTPTSAGSSSRAPPTTPPAAQTPPTSTATPPSSDRHGTSALSAFSPGSPSRASSPALAGAIGREDSSTRASYGPSSSISPPSVSTRSLTGSASSPTPTPTRLGTMSSRLY